MLLWFFSVVAHTGYWSSVRKIVRAGLLNVLVQYAKSTGQWIDLLTADNYVSAFPTVANPSVNGVFLGELDEKLAFYCRFSDVPKIITVDKILVSEPLEPGAVFDLNVLFENGSSYSDAVVFDKDKLINWLATNWSRIRNYCDLAKTFGFVVDRQFADKIPVNSLSEIESALSAAMVQAQADPSFTEWADMKNLLIGSLAEPGVIPKIIGSADTLQQTFLQVASSLDESAASISESRVKLANSVSSLNSVSTMANTTAQNSLAASTNLNQVLTELRNSKLSLDSRIQDFAQVIETLRLDNSLGTFLEARITDMKEAISVNLTSIRETVIQNHEAFISNLQSQLRNNLDAQNTQLREEHDRLLNRVATLNSNLNTELSTYLLNVQRAINDALNTQNDRMTNFSQVTSDMLVSLADYKREITSRVVDWVKSIATMTEIDQNTLLLLDIFDKNLASIQTIQDALAELSLESSSLAAFSLNASTLVATLNKKLPDAADYSKFLADLSESLKTLLPLKVGTSLARDVVESYTSVEQVKLEKEKNKSNLLKEL